MRWPSGEGDRDDEVVALDSGGSYLAWGYLRRAGPIGRARVLGVLGVLVWAVRLRVRSGEGEGRTGFFVGSAGRSARVIQEGARGDAAASGPDCGLRL